MTWFYQLPYSVTCIIMLPALAILVFYMISKKKVICESAISKSFYFTLISGFAFGIWAFLLKTFHAFRIFEAYAPHLVKVLWVLFAILIGAAVLASIKVIKRSGPEKKAAIFGMILVGIGVVVMGVVYFIFKNRT